MSQTESVTGGKYHILLRNLIRDRTCGSADQLKELGGARGIAAQLHVSEENGMNTNDVPTNREKFGSNAPPPVESTSYLEFLLDACKDFTVLLLMSAAVVSLVIAFVYKQDVGHYAEGIALLASILLVTNVTAINDYSKQKQFMRLNAAVEDVSVRCLRDGVVKDVKSTDLVVGDVVQLAVGDMLAADGILIQGDGVSTDESALTGEPKLIQKSRDRNPFLLSGTKVMEGTGTFLVIAVGPNSEAGQIRELIRNKKKDTKKPSGDGGAEESGDGGKAKSVLTAKLDRIAITVGKIASFVALIALIVMCFRYAGLTFWSTDPDRFCVKIDDSTCASDEVIKIGNFTSCSAVERSQTCCSEAVDGSGAELYGSRCPWVGSMASNFIEFLITAITIIVVAIPEGLPLAVTLSLAFSVRKMQSENNLVKHLDACETMGSATTICSDKTGTLTKNRMTVVESMIGVNSSISLKSEQSKIPASIRTALIECFALGGSADIEWNSEIGLWDQIGSKTECALLQTLKDDLRVFESYKEIRKSRGNPIVKKFPFSSAAKKSGFVIQSNSGYRMYLIGASEIILEQCGAAVDGDSTIQMSEMLKVQVLKKIDDYALQAMRTLCCSYMDLPASINLDSLSPDTVGHTLLCLVGIEDPLRDEVPVAIKKCDRAGVDVKMVTGDNITTAIAIAKRCGIIRESDLDPATGEPKPNVAMTGPDFRKTVLDQNESIRQSEIDKIWPTLRVLARSSPTDKYTLVTGMLNSNVVVTARDGRQIKKQVIAVTGDGTNDAPALKRADVGFAMGVTGTAVARDAADIILLDDNFASIVVACKWGRNVFDSIQKFLQFQITVNIVAVTIALEGAFIYNDSPIKAIQMLWVNLLMDALASLALATEPPTEELLNRPPNGRDDSAISSIMWWNILGQALFQLLVLNGIFFAAPSLLDIPSGVDETDPGAPASQHFTMLFNTLVLMQLTNQVNSRKLNHEVNVFENFFDNPLFVIILLLEAAGQVLIIFFGGVWFKTTPLDARMWGISLAFSVGAFPVQWLIIWTRKIVHRLFPRCRQESVVPKTPVDAQAPHGAMASILGPLPPSSRKLADLEAGAVVQPPSRSGSGALKSFSAKNLKELVGAPDVEDLSRTYSGGFKNPTRQAHIHKRFKKLNSFSNDSSLFADAAKEYRRSATQGSGLN